MPTATSSSLKSWQQHKIYTRKQHYTQKATNKFSILNGILALESLMRSFLLMIQMVFFFLFDNSGSQTSLLTHRLLHRIPTRYKCLFTYSSSFSCFFFFLISVHFSVSSGITGSPRSQPRPGSAENEGDGPNLVLALPTYWVAGVEKRTWGLGFGRSVTKRQDKMGGHGRSGVPAIWSDDDNFTYYFSISHLSWNRMGLII